MLKKVALAVSMLALGIGTAQAQISAYHDPLPKISLHGGTIGLADSPVYDSLAGVNGGTSYFAFSPDVGLLGFDDYVADVPGSEFVLTDMGFVGGLRFPAGTSAEDRTLSIGFFDMDFNLVNFFDITLNSSGNFLYSPLASVIPANFIVPTAGVLALFAPDNTPGQWFLTTEPPIVGSNDPTVGGAELSDGTPLYHAFSLSGTALAQVPEPGAYAFLIASGVPVAAFALRRRRRA